MAITRRETGEREKALRQQQQRQQQQQQQQQAQSDRFAGTYVLEDPSEPHLPRPEENMPAIHEETEGLEEDLEPEVRLPTAQAHSQHTHPGQLQEFSAETVAIMDRLAWEAIANRCAPLHTPGFARPPRAQARRSGCSKDNDDQMEREFHAWFDLDAENRTKRVGEVVGFLLDFLTDIDRLYNLSLVMHFARGESNPAKRSQPGPTDVVHWESRAIRQNPEYLAAAQESAEIFDTRIAEPRQQYYRTQIKNIRAKQEKEKQWQEEMLLHVASQKKERERRKLKEAEEAEAERERERERNAIEEEREAVEVEELARALAESCTVARRIHLQNVSIKASTPGGSTSCGGEYTHSVPHSIVALLNKWQEPLGVSDQFLVTLDAIFRHLPPHTWATALMGYDLEDELIRDILVLYTKILEPDGSEVAKDVKGKGKGNGRRL
ncbi:hypothetical protein BOTBODRAFT_637488 [Botryobasidium botryosum FD-172 SS1]|uniref:Uncharacterized protein n=1 Tax=Botryobasidium botryosum (strain FD-172 SS1) TaxID=930990 RepID=A0A067M7E4_BOTB1|nr:hypothetical protein BOTBODRAFT_637488 [Botryobasidium botryosum FD-172 SS1]